MAQEIPISEEIQRLIHSSEKARAVLGAEFLQLKHKLDLPARFKESLRIHPTGWMGGSALAGLAGSLLFRRKTNTKTEKPKKKGPLGFLLGLGIAAARPAVKVWLAARLKEFVGSKFSQPSPNTIPSRTSRRTTPLY